MRLLKLLQPQLRLILMQKCKTTERRKDVRRLVEPIAPVLCDPLGGQGIMKIPPTQAPASNKPPRTLSGIGGRKYGAQLPGR